MGMHTWFYKDKTLYNEAKKIYQDYLDKFENDEIYLDDLEVLQLNTRLNEIDKLNDTEFHDVFRTNKREQNNGEYSLDVIYSKEECNKWLTENKELVHNLNKDHLDEFWNKYPNGVIDFG